MSAAQSEATSALRPRQHFLALDGLRGIAAISVVVFHFMEFVAPSYRQSFIGHGFLAVDFFFCLSGFVIGYAYDARLPLLGTRQFLLARLIRLHPLVVLGSVLGLLTYFLDPFAAHPLPEAPGRLALLFLASIFLIPFPAMKTRYYNLFGLNAPAWSLFWEYIANLVYALVLIRLSRRALVVVTAVAAVLLCYVGVHTGTLLGGWSGGTFWQGGARVAYSFSAGLLVYRSGFIVRSRLGFTALALLLLAGLAMPWAHHDYLTELPLVLLGFPLLIALGAGATLTPRSETLCRLSGELSYPLYMTHYAVIWSFGNLLYFHHLSKGQIAAIITLGVPVLIAFASAVYVFYDRPLRAFLTAHLRRVPARS